MSSAAVIGAYENICIYKLIGFKTVEATTSEQAKKEIERLLKEDIAIIFVAEEFLEELDDFNESTKACIVSIPFSHREKSRGLASLKNKVLKATGSEMIFGKD